MATVNVGFAGTLGYAPGDLTSVVAAGEAGGLPDATVPDRDVTELRVHGVSGSNGPTMLEHPHALQVAGDSTTMFYRRWLPGARSVDGDGPSVPRQLEAYSWGGLTESPLASAAWILLTPFLLINVAHFALPADITAHAVAPTRSEPATDGAPTDTAAGPGPTAGYLPRSAARRVPQAVLRLIGLSATVQFGVLLGTAFVGIAAYQAKAATYPSLLRWYPNLPLRGRVLLAVLAALAVVGGLWWISVKTAAKYEARTSDARPTVTSNWSLTQTGFWRGEGLVARQRSLHAAAALVTVALVLSRPTSHHMPGIRVVVFVASLGLIAVVAITLASPLAERYAVTMKAGPTPFRSRRGLLRDLGDPALIWCQLLLAAAAALLVVSALLGSWTEPGQHAATLTGLATLSWAVLATQALLLLVFAIGVLALYTANRPIAKTLPEFPTRWRRADSTLPFFGGQLATLLAVLAVCVGAMLQSSVLLLFTRYLGPPLPSGASFKTPPAHGLAVPWPEYAMGATAAGLVVGGAVGALWLFLVFRRDCHTYVDRGRYAHVSVAQYYTEARAVAPGDSGSPARQKAIARAWAMGRVADRAGVLVGWIVGGMLAAIAAALVYADRHASGRTPLNVHGLATLAGVIGLSVAGTLVGLLRSAYSDSSKRKTIGALWDVATFWPRAAHPFAPPCYAERAIPELVDRLRILTGTVEPTRPKAGTDTATSQIDAHRPFAAQHPDIDLAPTPVLLTGYSQGAAITPAVVAQLPPATLDKVALLTLACPARRLYGRAFPGYFGPAALAQLESMLTDAPTAEGTPPSVRWRNVVRRTDYIGSWITTDPPPSLIGTSAAERVDQPCPDPAVLATDSDPTPPPIHAHSAFFPDPFVRPVAAQLSAQLIATSGAPLLGETGP